MTSGIPARDPIVLTNGQITNIWLLFFEHLYSLYVQTDASNSQALEDIRAIALSAKSIAEQAQQTNTAQAQQIDDIVDQITELDTNKANKADLQPIEDIANDVKQLVLQLQQDLLELQSQLAVILNKNYDAKIAQLSNQILTAVTQLSDLYAVKADKVTQMIAGNGLTGGGDLSADRTFTLGAPSNITSATTNSVSSTSHTHALDDTGVIPDTYGNTIVIPVFSVDTKGRITAVGPVYIRDSTTSVTGIVQLATATEVQDLTELAKAVTPAGLAAATAALNTPNRIVIRDALGNFAAGTILAELMGNATTATSWETPRTITIGGTGKSLDGTANVSWNLSEIGALPIAGGTMTGSLTLAADPSSALQAATKQYVDSHSTTVTVGTTTTGVAGSSASVTNSGSSTAAVLDFTIPRGADGISVYRIGAAWPGGGNVVTVPAELVTVFVPTSGTISKWTMLTTGGISGSCAVDIRKVTYASFPPTAGNTICAGAPPTISGGIKNQDTTMTGWTKTVSAGDVLQFVVQSNSNFLGISLILEITPS